MEVAFCAFTDVFYIYLLCLFSLIFYVGSVGLPWHVEKEGETNQQAKNNLSH